MHTIEDIELSRKLAQGINTAYQKAKDKKISSQNLFDLYVRVREIKKLSDLTARERKILEV